MSNSSRTIWRANRKRIDKQQHELAIQEVRGWSQELKGQFVIAVERAIRTDRLKRQAAELKAWRALRGEA